MATGIVRYPGSKSKLVRHILSRFPAEISTELWGRISPGWEYREPFVGSGAVARDVIPRLHGNQQAWINDIDRGIVSIWSMIQKNSQGLIERMIAAEPSAEKYRECKRLDGAMNDQEVVALRKIILHQTSFSGLGFMSGGPLGGKDQDNAEYPVNCRWNPERLGGIYRELHETLNRVKVRITNVSYEKLIEGAGENVFLYCDPPYYEKGPQLYKFAFKDEDHVQLAGMLRDTKAQWVLSYDDHPFIRDLYSWARFKVLRVTSTVAQVKVSKRPKNKEVLITPC